MFLLKRSKYIWQVIGILKLHSACRTRKIFFPLTVATSASRHSKDLCPSVCSEKNLSTSNSSYFKSATRPLGPYISRGPQRCSNALVCSSTLLFQTSHQIISSILMACRLSCRASQLLGPNINIYI